MQYGFDIGGTKIEIVAFDDNYNELFKTRKPTPTDDYDAFLDTLVSLVHQADEFLGCENQVGIGMPGVIDKRSGSLLSSNIPAASGRKIGQDLSQILSRKTALENDCKCFAYSEANGGAGEGYQSVFGAILGTGVGGGLCFEGRLIKGHNGIAGEWGHSPLPAMFVDKYQLPIRPCGCGKQGCIEQYISGGGLAYLYQFCGGEDLSTAQVIARLRQGDNKAQRAFAIFLDILGASLAAVIHTYDPDAIVFGGGLSKVDELYVQLPKYLQAYLLKGVEMPMLLAPKYGDSSGVRGAAMMAATLLN